MTTAAGQGFRDAALISEADGRIIRPAAAEIYCDPLFIKNSEAMVTRLVVKDRELAHNPKHPELRLQLFQQTPLSGHRSHRREEA